MRRAIETGGIFTEGEVRIFRRATKALRLTEDRFDGAALDCSIDALEQRCHVFADAVGAQEYVIDLVAEARLDGRAWLMDVPLRTRRFAGRPRATRALLADFHAVHDELSIGRAHAGAVEVVGVRARVACPLPSRYDARAGDR